MRKNKAAKYLETGCSAVWEKELEENEGCREGRRVGERVKEGEEGRREGK